MKFKIVLLLTMSLGSYLYSQGQKKEKEVLEKAILTFLEIENFDFKSLSNDEIQLGDQNQKFQEKIQSGNVSLQELDAIREGLKKPLKLKVGPRFYEVPEIYWELKDVIEKQTYHMKLIRDSKFGNDTEKESAFKILSLYQYPAVGFAPPGALVDVFVDNQWMRAEIQEVEVDGMARVFLTGYGRKTNIPYTSIAKFKYFTENQKIKVTSYKYLDVKAETQKKCNTFSKQLDCISHSPYCLWNATQTCVVNPN